MSLEALRVRFRSRAARGRLDPRSQRRGIVRLLVAVLALAASSCQSGPTGPSSRSGAYLEFTVQPPVYSRVDQPLSSPVQVSVVDASGRTLAGSSLLVTVALGTNPSDATLLGRTTMPTSGGVATFSDLGVDQLGTYYLVATALGVPLAASAPFEIDLAPSGSGAQVVGGNKSTVRVRVVGAPKDPVTTAISRPVRAGGGAIR